MLEELRVRDLGVIDDVTLRPGPGMTALTGETGAGKTLVVEAIALLLGGRADPVLVRPGAAEALVEGRFTVVGAPGVTLPGPAGAEAPLPGFEEEGTAVQLWPGTAGDGAGEEEVGGEEGEVILSRSVPAVGRSRAWVNGRMAPIGNLAQAAALLVDLHGQHAHRALFEALAQRSALDEYARIDLGPLRRAGARVADLERAIEALGGDEHARAREVDLLRYQIDEIERAGIDGPDLDARLAEEEERLAGAAALRDAAGQVVDLLADSPRGSVADLLGASTSLLSGHAPLSDLEARVRACGIEIGDLVTDLRAVVETWEDDPERLEALRERRQALRLLCRKYGDDLTDVLVFAAEARKRLDLLLSVDDRAAALLAERDEAERSREAAAAQVGSSRRAAAAGLAAAVAERLREMAMPNARFEVTVGDADPGDGVTFLLGANRGEPALPLAKVASGGELARTMLALHLVLSSAPGTLVFDEVDAGIGGEAALAVGRALARLARRHQVLVVTHLPQVAAFADRQIAVRKQERHGRTVSELLPLDAEARVVELSRMLSGHPENPVARRHAQELLSLAAADAETAGASGGEH